MKNRTLPDRLLLFACFFPLYLIFSGSSFLWDFDETYFASAGMLMHQRGNWIVPIVNMTPDGSPIYGDKPILMFWGILVSFSLFGVNEMAARFPSVCYGVLTLQLVYTLIRHLFDRKTALLGGFILGTMFMVCVESSSLTTDATLLFWKVVALLLYVQGVLPESHVVESSGQSQTFFPRSYLRCVLIYVCLGFAFLAKGPVGTLLPMAVISVFMLIKRLPPLPVVPRDLFGRMICLLRPFHPWHFLKTVWAMRPLTGLVVVTLIAAPWYIAVHRATDGAWTKLFFGIHNLGRALAPMEGHGYPLDFLWYYTLFLLVITLPWSIFFGPTLLDTIRRLRLGTPNADGYIFAVCWVCVYVVLFSVIRTKMPNYVYFATPAMAMLFAAYLRVWAEHRALVAPRWMDAALIVLVVIGGVLLVLLPLVLIPLFVPVPCGNFLFAVPAVMLVTTIVLVWVLHHRPRTTFLTGMTLAAIAMAFSVFCLGARVVSQQQNYAIMFTAAKEECANPVFCSFHQDEPSWVFYGKMPIPCFSDNPDDNTADMAAFQRFLDDHLDNAYVITSRETYEEVLQPKYGDRFRVVITLPYFLKLARVLPDDEHTQFGYRSRELVVLANTSVQGSLGLTGLGDIRLLVSVHD